MLLTNSPHFVTIERQFFRALNAVAEPALRRGIGSYKFAPAGLVLLESVGFKSGKTRNTPLLSLAFGPYRIVSTARGDRSFWVKNLIKQPSTAFFLGGERNEADALVFRDGEPANTHDDNGPTLRFLSGIAARAATNGWAVAILIPATTREV